MTVCNVVVSSWDSKQIWDLCDPSSLWNSTSEARTGEILCTALAEFPGEKTLVLSGLPVLLSLKLSKNRLLFPPSRWLYSLDNCLQLHSPHSCPAVRNWYLNPVNLIRYLLKSLQNFSSKLALVQDPLPLEEPYWTPLVLGALQRQSWVPEMPIWNLCVQKCFLKKCFAFKISQIFVIIPLRGISSAKQLRRKLDALSAELIQSRSNKCNGAHWSLFPKGYLVS